MEIRPILSALMRNRAGAVLVALQIAITLAIVVNAIYSVMAAQPGVMTMRDIPLVHGMGV